MLGWLKNLIVRWRERDRLIFRYWDGAKWRAIDPFVAHRAIWATPDWIQDAKVVVNPQRADGSYFYPAAMVLEAEDNLRNMTRQVFDVEAWTEEDPGLTLIETDKLLQDFMAFCEDLKKKLKTSPTSSAPSGSTEPVSSLDTGDCPDGAESDCASMPTELTAGAPSGP
jgi:hypothetical protein